MKAEQRSASPFSPPKPHSFLGLLGDHVARGGHGTAAVRLLLLSWFQNLKQEHVSDSNKNAKVKIVF